MIDSRQILGPSFFLVVFLGACSGSVESVVGDDGGPSEVADGGSDAAVRRDGGKLDSGGSDVHQGSDAGGEICNNLLNSAPPVAINQVADFAPVPIGGPIADGIYFLTAVTLYTGVGGASGPTGSEEAVTVQVAGSTFQSVVQGGTTVTQETTTFTPSSLTSLAATTTCPLGPSPTTVGYSADLTTFSMQSSSGGMTGVATYTKQ